MSWEGGVQRWSGLLDVALAGYVAKPSNGWYCRVDRSSGRLSDSKSGGRDTLTAEFWEPILGETDVKEYVQQRYSILTEAVNDGE